MQFRPLGSSGIQVSCVGFGTAQLRRVPRTQAIDTLLAGFDRGVSIVHTAPDYEGADRLVAEAVLRSGRKIIVASNGYDTSGNATGKVRHFERLFESTCRMLKTDRLELFGIASVEDREAGQENIWGKDGMVEFLQKMKATGRLGAIFCTTHGKPEFARRLIESGAFDAIMLSYNVLGFHSLTLNPPASWHFEDIRRTREELFPLCKAKGMGLMIMLPLAAGMLTPSKAFPPPDGSAAVPPGVAAGEALRAILENPEVSCVLPGTASVEEAIENASAGVAERIATRPEAGPHALRIAEMTTSLCSRCGECEPTCSQGLPVAWLFRAAYMGGVYRTSPYETWEDVEYFRLQPQGPSTCSGCVQQTCRCPARIDIPITLDRLHQTMLRRVSEGRVQPPPELRLPPRGDRWCSARLVTRELPLARSLKQVWRAGREHRPPTVDQVWYRDRRAPSIPTRKPCRNRRRAAVRRDAGGAVPFRAGMAATGGYRPRDISCGRTAVSGPPDPIVAIDRTVSAGPRRRGDVCLSQSAPHLYGVEWVGHNVPSRWPQSSAQAVYVHVRNVGTRTWRADEPKGRSVDLVMRVDGAIRHMVRVPRDILPGEETTFYVLHSVEPRLGLGGAVQDVSFNLVEQNVTWFEHQNVESLVVQVAAEPAEGSNAAGYFQIGSLIGSSFYLPSGGVTRGASDRPYPLFLREAAGCRVRDGDGNEWIDYVMGWGSALLGYAHPEIREAVAQSLCNGAILSLPTELEIEVAYQLGEMIPNAQKVLFGKNGSDVCTAAVRLARVKTGRPLILFSGYSGWQEPFAPVFEKSLHDPSATCRAIRFAPNDLAEVSRLFEHHPVQIAGVILEPAAQVEGVDGPVQVADAVFLRSLKLMCQAHGTVLIFDEIMTGFRHPGGNVQNATGVTPDLACFGKALTSGMPLAALVGQREVMDHVARIFYHPTFKSDAYSLAAARAALQIYQREDIPAKVASFGERLRAAVAECSVESGMDGELVSPPYRMVYRFNEPDLNRRTLLRTLLHRELLARGILTFRGFMLPSAAHGDAELERTVDGFRGAFAAIRQAAAHRSLVSSLEIPPVV